MNQMEAREVKETVEHHGEKIELSIPNKAEFVSVVRLTLVAIANRVGFNIEEIEDMKVAIAEACTNAITHGNNTPAESINIHFTLMEKGLEIEVKDKGVGCDVEKIEDPKIEELNENGLGIFIIRSLMDDVKIHSEPDQGMTIIMTKMIG
ncbi:ATP-binding protein [Isachenkonia alkalipeptolytica]|nr:ATP-binding protein [Isachenkonia alkalipeptolytica]